MSSALLLVAAALLAPPPSGAAPLHPVVFQSEEVTLTLYPDVLEVVGRYRFVNTSDAPAHLGIRFPFPVDGGHPAPALVEADALGLRLLPDAAAWRLSLGPREVRDVTVRYLQPHDGRSATYITTSARAWRRPLEHARFVVRWPTSIGEVQASVPLETRIEGGDRLGVFEASDYVPDVDVELRW